MKLVCVLVALVLCQLACSKPIGHKLAENEPMSIRISAKKSSCGFVDPPTPRFRSFGNEDSTVIWENKEITWAIVEETKQMTSERQAAIMVEAFQYWEAVIPRKFVPAENASAADVQIRFATGKHCTDEAFDGPGGVLAHAALPKVGQLHFDDDEGWYSSNDGKHLRRRGEHANLLWIAVHELGHILGLWHADPSLPDAIMAAKYDDDIQTDRVLRLSADDIRRIQALYGVKNDASVAPEEDTTTAQNDASLAPEGSTAQNDDASVAPDDTTTAQM